jgi:acetyl-CoA acetyltransferase
VSPQPFVPFPIGEVQFPEGIAIKVAHQAIALGECDSALAVGFDCSPEGFFQALWEQSIFRQTLKNIFSTVTRDKPND